MSANEEKVYNSLRSCHMKVETPRLELQVCNQVRALLRMCDEVGVES